MNAAGKPEWAQMMAKAIRLEREAQNLREMAQRRRCPAEESGGVQCSKDKDHGQRHHWKASDLP